MSSSPHHYNNNQQQQKQPITLEIQEAATTDTDNNYTPTPPTSWFLHHSSSASLTDEYTFDDSEVELNNTTTPTPTTIHVPIFKTKYSHSIVLYVNGKRHQLQHPNPELTLGDFLRTNLNLTGTKIGCSEGGCGACVVMLSHFDHSKQMIINRSVNACLYPLISADGHHVVTVEGVGTTRDDMLHLIRERVREFHASQCGFCTPGFVMSLYVLLRNNPHPTLEEVERALDGNLCRCTGYRPILDAARSLIEDQFSCCNSNSNNHSDCSTSSISGCGKKDCCQLKNTKNGNGNTTNGNANLGNSINSDPLFPFELRSYKFKPLLCTNSESLSDKSLKWYRPTSLEQFLEVLLKYPKMDKRFIVGNSEIAIEVRMKNKHYPIIIQPTHIKELLECYANYGNSINGNTINGNECKSLIIGTSTTISNLEQFIKQQISQLPPHQSQSLLPILHQTKYFASTPIRNAACLGGNIVTASPASDLNPLWVALDCQLKIMTMDGQVKMVKFDEFFTGYRQVQLKKSELLIHLEIPLPTSRSGCSIPNDQSRLKSSDNDNSDCIQIVKAFKQSKRREDDIAIVTSGMKIKLFTKNVPNMENSNMENTNIENTSSTIYYIKDVKLVFGGMNAYTISAEKTRQFLLGRELNDPKTFSDSLQYLMEDLPLGPNAPGGMVEYRKTLSLSFYYKFYLYCIRELKIKRFSLKNGDNDDGGILSDEELSVLLDEHYIPREHYPVGQQIFSTIPIVNNTQSTTSTTSDNTVSGGVVGKSLHHHSSHIQVSGEAKYVDDLDPLYGQCYAALVQSTRPLATIKSINYDQAMKMKGVIGWVDHSDVKGHNRVGAVDPNDEELFVSERVSCIGQLIALIIAETPLQAKLAAKKVVVEYSEESKENQQQQPIFSIESALKANSFLLKEKKISSSPPLPSEEASDDKKTKKTALERIEELSNSDKNLRSDYLIISGNSYTNSAQEHFYIEPISTIAIPNQPDYGEMTIYCTTQAPTHTQMTVAEVLGIPSHRVVCKVKRLGGGFGGKESKPTYFAAAISVAAFKFNRPIRLTLDRDVDMSSTGQRHPYYVQYQSAINTSTLKIDSISMELIANGGYSMDLSESVLNRAMQCADNCYKIPYFTIIGRICKTNQLSNTAFRGFGGPQGCMAMEIVMEHLVHELSIYYFNILRNNIENIENNLIIKQLMSENENNLSLESIQNKLAILIRRVNFYAPPPPPPQQPNLLLQEANLQANTNTTTNAADIKLENNDLNSNVTPFGMKIPDSDRIHRLFDETLKHSNYYHRLNNEIEPFNHSNRYRKRGLSLIPVKFGIAFGAPFLNQGGALIQIYFNDGSVLLSIGGVCMGQGLFTKMIQCCSSVLGISSEFIRMSDTSTDKVPNTSATAASVSSDLYGQAVVKACHTLNNRLDGLKRKLFPHLYSNSTNTTNSGNEEYNLDNALLKEDLNTIIEDDINRLPPQLNNEQWKQLVKEAYFQGDIQLSATGYYSTAKDVHFNWSTGEGKPFNYFTYGCAASEVEIDTLTGDWSCLRTDIVMDLGNSLNPAIDIGQIEGAFIQGMGLYTMEEFIYGDEQHKWIQPQGSVFTRGPGMYKIPSAGDIPMKFNVHLLDSNNNKNGGGSSTKLNTINQPGTNATLGSKAVGEPPLFLGSSVYFALKSAIKSARMDSNLSQYFVLDPPATTEKIRMACHDQFVEKFINSSSDSSSNSDDKSEPYLRIKGSY